MARLSVECHKFLHGGGGRGGRPAEAAAVAAQTM